MRKVLAVILIITMLLCAVACGKTEPAPEPQDSGEFISPAGWSVKYDPAVMECNEIDGGAKFTLLEADDTYIAITSTEDGKMPQEVLYEHTSDWDETQTRSEGYLVGTEDKWCYNRVIFVEEDGASVCKQFTAAEYGSGVILFEIHQRYKDDGQDMGRSDVLAEVMDSIQFDFFPAQTELYYVPGTYVEKYTEEMEGEEYEFVNVIELNEDHTGTISIQDKIDIIWGSTEIIGVDAASSRYEYTIEGDKLYLHVTDDVWSEFDRALPKYYHAGEGDIEAAVCNYLSQNVGNELLPGQVCIPAVNIINVDDSDKSDIRVLGDFWVFDYELEEDTLVCVSGGAYPGLIHIKDEGQNPPVVTGMDVVDSGSGYTESAKKIFGDYYDAYMKASADDVAREQIRKEMIQTYVHANYLDNVKKYKDYGWDPVEID